MGRVKHFMLLVASTGEVAVLAQIIVETLQALVSTRNIDTTYFFNSSVHVYELQYNISLCGITCYYECPSPETSYWRDFTNAALDLVSNCQHEAINQDS